MAGHQGPTTTTPSGGLFPGGAHDSADSTGDEEAIAGGYTDTNGLVKHNNNEPNNGGNTLTVDDSLQGGSSTPREDSQDSTESSRTNASSSAESSMMLHQGGERSGVVNEARNSDYLLDGQSVIGSSSTMGATTMEFAHRSGEAQFSYATGNDDVAERLADTSEYSNGEISRKKGRSSRKGPSRGRPKKALVAMYHSQISGDKNTIKIRIKKNLSHVQLPPSKKKTGRRKRHKPTDSDASDNEPPPTAKRSRPASSSTAADGNLEPFNPEDQSPWGRSLPEHLLRQIFQLLTVQDGALPILIRLCKVCKLWRDVALAPELWRKVDLNWVKEKARTDIKLNWLVQNRLTHCQDINFGEWKMRNIQIALKNVNESCPELRGLNLSGWKGLSADNIKYITTEFQKLQRLDLSSINPTSSLNAQPLISLGQTMNSRLTHLVLANNKLAGFSQIIQSIATNCPNLELFDISNIHTFAQNAVLLPIEKLQTGCPKLKVLRITSSPIWLAPTTIAEQIASPGFPKLEELSLAGQEEMLTTTAQHLTDDGIERILKNSTKLRLLDVRGCIRLTDSGLVKVPAWDLEHLFLSSCCVTRTQNSGLELILQKWSHSLLEVDLAWSTAKNSLDAAVLALAEKGKESPLRTINLCGSSISLEPVKALLAKCPSLHSINLQSCRALPRGIKRLYTGESIQKLREALADRPAVGAGEDGAPSASPVGD